MRFTTLHHQAGRAAETPISELRDGAYVLGELSEEKANVAYTFENTQTRMVPTFEHVVKMYEDEVFAFGRLATALVYTNACINALLLLAIAFFVIRALVRVMRNMQVRTQTRRKSTHSPDRLPTAWLNFGVDAECTRHQQHCQGDVLLRSIRLLRDWRLG